MKKVKCPYCGDNLKLKTAGNTDGGKFEITRKAKRGSFGSFNRYKKITQGSKYQMVLVCNGANRGQKSCGGKMTVVANSKADAHRRINRSVQR